MEQIIQLAHALTQKSPNNEISISYQHTREKWYWNTFIINNIFYFQVAINIIRNDEYLEQKIVA